MTYKILAAMILAFVVAGCGQSGPLYIPGNPSKIEQPPPKAESTAEEEAEEDGKTDKD
jgi:predicted small lipoprotein YifL